MGGERRERFEEAETEKQIPLKSAARERACHDSRQLTLLDVCKVIKF